MRVIGLQIIDEFCRIQSRACSPAGHWISNVRNAEWKSLADIRKTFRTCDKVGTCYVFNIGGNKFRLIAKINFKSSIVVVKDLLLHKDYDSDKWKTGCE